MWRSLCLTCCALLLPGSIAGLRLPANAGPSTLSRRAVCSTFLAAPLSLWASSASAKCVCTSATECVCSADAPAPPPPPPNPKAAKKLGDRYDRNEIDTIKSTVQAKAGDAERALKPVKGLSSQGFAEASQSEAKAKFEDVVAKAVAKREATLGFELDEADIKELRGILRIKYCGPEGLIGPC